MRKNCLLIVLVLGCLLSVAACGGTSAETSPSPTPNPSPSPTPSPAPTPGPGGSSLTISPQSVQGQAQPQATVTLPNAAPAGGAIVQLSSDNPTAARVPASVLVQQGSRSATFTIDTATVSASQNVRITATYAGTTLVGMLMVNPPSLSASFVVRSKSRGLGACAVDTESRELDCVFDGNASTGFVSAYLWSFTMGSKTQTQTAAAPNAAVAPQGTGCDLYQQGTGGDGPNGERYLRMQVSLQVRDGSGILADAAPQQVKVFPNQQCGFSY